MKLTSIYQVHFPAVNWLVAHVEIRRAAKCYQPHNQFGKILWLCAPHTIVPFPKQEYLELQPKILIELEEGSIDTQRDFYFPSIFRPKPLQFFFLWGNISRFQLDKGMWRLQIIAGLWVATNCLAWQIFIGRFTGGFLLAEVVSRLFRERSGTIGDARDGPPFKQTLKTMM